jgi:cation:H+ antiporter
MDFGYSHCFAYVLGAVVGSNIFNILGVLGLSTLISPHGIQVSSSAFHFDIPVMIAVAAACLPIFLTGHTIARWEGFVFLGYYILYTVYIVMKSQTHMHVETFGNAILFYVLPLTLITFMIELYRHQKVRQQKG